MEPRELRLEYLKILIWPIFALVLIFSFRSQLTSVLEGGFQADILGVQLKSDNETGINKLKEQIGKLQENVGDLTDQLMAHRKLNASLVQENEKLSKALEAEIRKQGGGAEDEKVLRDNQETLKTLTSQSNSLFSSIEQKIDSSQKILGGSKYERARSLELEMFEHLLQGRYREAMSAARKASQAYPGYHNVYEIERLLREHENELLSPDRLEAAGKKLIGEIVEKYSWGMPEDTKQKMRAKL